jgi:hypothetical protein
MAPTLSRTCGERYAALLQPDMSAYLAAHVLMEIGVTMTETSAHDAKKNEIEATMAVYEALQPLDEDAQQRVLEHVSGMLGVKVALKSANSKKASGETPDERPETEQSNGVASFETFGELFNAADPQTDADRALVAGYWLQVCKNAENFVGHGANKELNHLGHRVGNITAALSDLISRRPAPVIQLAKSGSSRQARKTYKVTKTGVDAVRDMLNG